MAQLFLSFIQADRECMCLLQVHHTDAEWKSMLSPGQYRVLRRSGTELPRSSPLDHASHQLPSRQPVLHAHKQGQPAACHVPLLPAGVPPVSASPTMPQALDVCCTGLSYPELFLHHLFSITNWFFLGRLWLLGCHKATVCICRRKEMAHSSAQDAAAQCMSLKQNLTRGQAGHPSFNPLLVLLMRPWIAQSHSYPE